MEKIKSKIHYYFWATYRRKILDRLLLKNVNYYRGIVLDIGGRDRGRFVKQKEVTKVNKWIFADIEERHSPDIILDIADMIKIRTESIDVINAIEVFEHVENPEKGLRECHRVLKRDGIMILSSPFLYPVHGDPLDFQRWTEDKWRKELESLGFRIEQIEIMGKYFTVLAEIQKVFIKSMPRILKLVLYMFYPILDLLVMLDNLKFIKDHPKLGKFHGGYFFITRK